MDRAAAGDFEQPLPLFLSKIAFQEYLIGNLVHISVTCRAGL